MLVIAVLLAGGIGVGLVMFKDQLFGETVETELQHRPVRS